MQKVTFSNGCPGYMTGQGSKTGLIVIQEWWGVNDQIKQTAEKFAAASPMLVLIPDLYRGQVAFHEDEASHLMSNLDWQSAVQDIQAAVDYLKENGCEKIAVVGFCMGEALTIASCVHVGGIDCGICFYGIPDKEFAAPQKIRVPMQLHFGNLDECKGFSCRESADLLEKEMRDCGKDFEMWRYEAKHAFMNHCGPKYDEKAASVAFERTI
ncbi:dienelactone hydrolase, partial [Rozella allomycis CSF55]